VYWVCLAVVPAKSEAYWHRGKPAATNLQRPEQPEGNAGRRIGVTRFRAFVKHAENPYAEEAGTELGICDV